MKEEEKSKRIKQITNSYKVSVIIMTAQKLGIFSILDETEKTLKEISKTINIKKEKLEILLNALLCYNLISKNEKGYFLDEYKEQFSDKSIYNQIGYIEFSNVIMNRWNELDKSVKGEEKSNKNFKEITGVDAEKFIKGMNSNAMLQAQYIINNYDFTNHHTLDIGAGAGTYSIQIAKKYNIMGKMIDLPEITSIIERKIKEENVQSKLKVSSCDYRSKIPEGEFDDIFLFAVIHQENDENLTKLLEEIYSRLKVNGRLFLTSFFLNEDKVSPEFAVQFSIEMLVMSDNGKVYTHNEIKNHLKYAGFNNINRIDDIPSPATLYLAIK